jgi:SAM-dependent methyltransferase
MNSAIANSSLESLDLPESSIDHAQKIRSKKFLRKIYEEHYQFFADELRTAPSGIVLELGSGGGFIREIVPQVITSDVLPLPTIGLATSGLELPFRDAELGGVVMINVLHHLQNVDLFFKEAQRCLKPGGRILMVEPANTLWSRFIYKNFHHEPFIPEQQGWELPQGGRMSMANDALPWIVFKRDQKIFSQKYPKLKIDKVENFMPLRYLLSGGVSKPQLSPGWSYEIWKGIEAAISPINDWVGMFMRIVVTRGG